MTAEHRIAYRIYRNIIVQPEIVTLIADYPSPSSTLAILDNDYILAAKRPDVANNVARDAQRDNMRYEARR